MTLDFHAVLSCQGWLEFLDCILSSLTRGKPSSHFFLSSSSKTFIPSHPDHKVYQNLEKSRNKDIEIMTCEHGLKATGWSKKDDGREK